MGFDTDDDRGDDRTPLDRAGVEALLERAEADRGIDPADLDRVLAYVAEARFDPAMLERVRGNIARLFPVRTAPPLEVRYARHVTLWGEWPRTTSRAGYEETGVEVLRDGRSGIYLSRYGGMLQLGAIGPTPEHAVGGINSRDLTLVEYRAITGHWTTLHQPDRGLESIPDNPRRGNVIWLRRPTPPDDAETS